MALDLSLDSDKENYFDTQDMASTYGDPYGSYADPYKQKESRSMNTLEGMRQLASQYGYDVVEKTDSPIWSGIKTGAKAVGKGALHVLNAIPAFASGLGAGMATAPDGTQGERWGHVWDTIVDYEKNFKGYSDNIRLAYKDIGYKPGIVGKSGAFLGGLVVDSFMDPLAFLTKGFTVGSKIATELPALADDTGRLIKAAEQIGAETGAITRATETAFDVEETARKWNPATRMMEEVAAKVPVRATERGAQLLEQVKREGSILSLADQLVEEGADRVFATKMADDIAKQDVKKLVNEAYKSSGGTISQATFDKLLAKGYARGTLEEIKALGKELIQREGWNYWGMRLVDSKTLANSLVGKAAKSLYQNAGLEVMVESIKHPIKQAFVWGYMQNQKLRPLLDRMSLAGKMQISNEFRQIDELLTGLTPDEESILANAGLQRKMDTVSEIKKLQTERFQQLQEINPTIAAKVKPDMNTPQMVNLAKEIVDDDIVKVEKAVQDSISKPLKDLEDIARTDPSLGSVRSAELTTNIEKVKLQIDDLLKDVKKPKVKPVEKMAGYTDEEITASFDMLVGMRETIFESKLESLQSRLGNILSTIRKAEEAGLDTGPVLQLIYGGNKKDIKELVAEGFVTKSQLEIATDLRKQIQAVQDAATRTISSLQKERDDFIKGVELLDRTSAEVKAMRKGTFKMDDPKLDAVAQKLWGENGFIPKLAKSIGFPEEEMYDTYLPFMTKNAIDVNGFTYGHGISRMNQGLGKKASEWTMENFKAAGGITDLRTILSKHASRVVDTRVKESFMRSAVNQVGKSDEYFRQLAIKQTGFDDVTEEMIERAAKSMGYERYVVKTPTGGVEVGGYFPKEIIPELKNGYDTKGIGTLGVDGLVKTFDWMTNLWKSWVYGLFPSSHFRNMVSNDINTLIGMGTRALDPNLKYVSSLMSLADLESYKTLAKVPKANAAIAGWGTAAKEKLKKQVLVNSVGEEMNAWKLFKQIRREYPELFQSGQFGLEELGVSGDRLPAIIEKMPKSAKKLLDPNSSFWQLTRDVGSHIESSSKLMNIVGTWLEGGTVKEGIAMAEKNLFNYNKLTPFEKNVMKRIIPFYTFARKNAEFQMRMLAEKPGTTWLQYKLMNQLSDSFSNAHESDKEGMPAYLQDAMGFHTGRVGTKNHKFISGFGVPVEEFFGRFMGQGNVFKNAFDSVIEAANPLVKAPIEAATGKDLFSGKDIVEINNPDEFTSMIASMPLGVGKQFKNLVDYREVYKPIVVNGEYMGERRVVTANPWYLWFLRNSPAARVISTTTKLADIRQGERQGNLPYLWLTTGINVASIDDKKNRFYNRLNEYEELGKWLNRIGVLSTYESFYKPKTEEDIQSERLKKALK